jgi:glutamate-1-semialdehyde 2,1-aminomutase
MLVNGVLEKAKLAEIPLTANTVGGMFGFFFTDEENVSNFYQVSQCNLDRFNLFFHDMLNEGIYLAPSAYEAGFVSAAHTEEDIQNTIETAGKVFAGL